MKNVMIANFQKVREASSLDKLNTYLRAQIENSLKVGWRAKDILLLTNFEYEFLGVKARVVPMDPMRVICSMSFGLQALFQHGWADDVLWVHDLDAWQNAWFACPAFRDIGICEYSDRHNIPRYNCGSVFLRPGAKDIVNLVHFLLASDKEKMREEPLYHRVLNAPAYEKRVTVLDGRYNVGTSGFVGRYERSRKPILVCHFHPDDPTAARVHMAGRNPLRVRTVGPRLARIIEKYFDPFGRRNRTREGACCPSKDVACL